MEKPNAFRQKVFQWRIACWAVAGLSLIALVYAVREFSVTQGSLDSLSAPGKVFVVFCGVVGVVGLVVVPFMLTRIGKQVSFYDSLVSGERPVLLRWQCTAEEGRQFIASETVRLGVSRKTELYVVLLVFPAALLIQSLRGRDVTAVHIAILGAACVFLYFVLRLVDTAGFREAKRRASSEIVLAEDGFLAGSDVRLWRSVNLRLEQAAYEEGKPDALNLVFVPRGPATGQSVTVRVPVTATKADEARHLLLTVISKHLVAPPIVLTAPDPRPFEEIKAKAEAGDAAAQFQMGRRYELGEGVAKNPVESLKWYRKAAEQNQPKAQYYVGISYYQGDGVAKDQVEAAKWFRKAADHNLVAAKNNLGFCYEKGEGVTQDLAEAVKWYSEAAEQNDAMAQCNLAGFYATGKGLTQNLVEAYKWWLLAAAQGEGKAKKALAIYEEKMTPEQLAEGQKRAANFKPS